MPLTVLLLIIIDSPLAVRKWVRNSLAGRGDADTVADVVWPRHVRKEEGGDHVCGQAAGERADYEHGRADGQQPREQVDAPQHQEDGEQDDAPHDLQPAQQEAVQPVERRDRRCDQPLLFVRPLDGLDKVFAVDGSAVRKQVRCETRRRRRARSVGPYHERVSVDGQRRLSVDAQVQLPENGSEEPIGALASLADGGGLGHLRPKVERPSEELELGLQHGHGVAPPGRAVPPDGALVAGGPRSQLPAVGGADSGRDLAERLLLEVGVLASVLVVVDGELVLPKLHRRVEQHKAEAARHEPQGHRQKEGKREEQPPRVLVKRQGEAGAAGGRKKNGRQRAAIGEGGLEEKLQRARHQPLGRADGHAEQNGDEPCGGERVERPQDEQAQVPQHVYLQRPAELSDVVGEAVLVSDGPIITLVGHSQRGVDKRRGLDSDHSDVIGE
eukprot:scaffold2190_cov118-Isochrysis_galbana.AAC.6